MLLSRAMLGVALLPLAGCIETVDGPAAATAAIQLDENMVVRRGGLTFVKGWDLGRRVAAERQRPALVFFTAEWCTYCHKMEATTFADPAVAQAAGEFVCVLVDADLEPEVCRRLQIGGYPTLEILAPSGASLGRLTGWQAAPGLVASLEAALQRYAVLEQPLRR